MNSSTSSFKTEWKVIVAVLAVLGVCECVARLAGRTLDWDREHIYEFPAISRRLHESEGPRVLLLGNSLTLHGVCADELQAELELLGYGDCTVEKVVPVGTDVTDWIYVYRRFFANVEQCPDIVVVGFARHHVRDLKPPKRLRRLGRHFLDLSDATECFEHDVLPFEERAALLMSRALALYGDQLCHRETALYWMLPGFKNGERKLNRDMEQRKEAAAQAKRNGAEPPEPTFDRMRRLANLFKETGAGGLFVAMPLPDVWETDPQVEQIAVEAGMTYVDARKLSGVGSGDFPDGYHMGEEAKLVYSRFLAARIVERIRAAGVLQTGDGN